MVESPDVPSLFQRIRLSPGKSYASFYPFRAGRQRSAKTLSNTSSPDHAPLSAGPPSQDGGIIDPLATANITGTNVPDHTSLALPPPAPPPHENGQGEESAAIEPEELEEKPNIAFRIYGCCKNVLFASWLNVLLVFVPVAIAVQAAGVDKNIVFAMNAIAIVPLAGLLSYATESVAAEMGDTIGALMNVTFGNAVELIIFTPQHVIDEESRPGVLADMLNPSSSSDDSSTSSGSGSDGSSGSNTTAKRIKRVLKRGRRRRKFSAGSNDTPSVPSTVRTASASTFGRALEEQNHANHVHLTSASLAAIASGNEADEDREPRIRSTTTRDTTINARDFENEKAGSGSRSPKVQRKKKTKRKHRKKFQLDEKQPEASEISATHTTRSNTQLTPQTSTPRLSFRQDVQVAAGNSPKRPFNIRGMTVRDVVPAMPPMPKVLAGTVFSSTNPSGMSPGSVATTGITPRALHRASSLPSRLNQATRPAQTGSTLQPQPYMAPVTSANTLDSNDSKVHRKHMSRTAAVILLVISTGLVAVCAEFLISSIDHLVDNTSVSEAFIGLIILPIVGNAAEHVCAVTVATKNKMDLAIGVAVGSSIQIALFVTPVIVLLGWILQKDMSLYFSLFETISLFVSAFIVNFLVLDGRSNYLEGALLIAAYVIIAVAAFFYPDSDQQSTVGGGNSARTRG
ncbi:MAG: hypothetical protein Q9217_005505 [Psora testacea]